MKLSRSKNAVRNIRAGLFERIITLIGPFIVRTVFIRTLGAEYLGVNSLFSSILSVLSLTELGFGSAVVFNMYKAIAIDDTKSIDALLFFYRKVYRYVGFIILCLGLTITPFLTLIVKGSYPADINPYIVYLLFLINSSLSYFLFAYLNSLITAFQRKDINIRISIFLHLVMYILQIFLLLTVHSYYAYIAIMPLFTVVSNIITAIVAKIMFPQYVPRGELSKEQLSDIKEKVAGMVIQKLCYISRNAFDSIFISAFLGLTEIAKYNNYYYVMSAIIGFLAIATNSIIAGAGNSVAIESKEKNHHDMMRLNFSYMWASGWATICLLCLYQQFMTLWVGEQLLLPMSSVIWFCLYFYTLKMGDIRSVYVEATGIWWQNRIRAITEAITNIVLNYLLGKHFGINGIIAATWISLFLINFCYGSRLIYQFYFDSFKARGYFVFHARSAAVSAGIGLITFLLCYKLPSTIYYFLVRIIICLVIPNLLYVLAYHKTKMYKDALPWILTRIGIKDKAIINKLFLLQ